jgi:hypothetical protein
VDRWRAPVRPTSVRSAIPPICCRHTDNPGQDDDRCALRSDTHAQPTLPWLRWQLANCHCALGVVQRRAGRPAQAVASFRRSIALVEQFPTLTPRNHYGLACCHAQLAGVATDTGSGMTAEQAVAEGELAMATLSQAIAAGFDGVGRLRSDASLDTFRSREDFQKLLNEVEKKQGDQAKKQ